MIYEVTLFSNELDILDLKLNELDGIVDKFVLVEHPYNYLRQPKRLAYNENKERFKKFHNKIIHIIDGLPYDNKLGLDLVWERNNSSLIFDVLNRLDDKDFVLFTDSDALLKKEIVSNLDLSRPTHFHVDWYESYFNYKLLNVPFVWNVGIPAKYVKQHGILESLKLTRGMALQSNDFKEKHVVIKDAGYHFSKCGNIDDLLEHVKGHPHIERATNPLIANKELLQKRRDLGIMWDDMELLPPKPGIFETIPYDPKNYPSYLNEHPEIYDSYFKNGMNL
jgi:beta-1,4-mannosyl-glycoprotein beta-1,4-N-acetylglucosaminyltransferase